MPFKLNIALSGLMALVAIISLVAPVAIATEAGEEYSERAMVYGSPDGYFEERSIPDYYFEVARDLPADHMIVLGERGGCYGKSGCGTTKSSDTTSTQHHHSLRVPSGQYPAPSSAHTSYSYTPPGFQLTGKEKAAMSRPTKSAPTSASTSKVSSPAKGSNTRRSDYIEY
ncbi:unnamed protein product [Sympodiomycopsis kandeliae]